MAPGLPVYYLGPLEYRRRLCQPTGLGVPNPKLGSGRVQPSRGSLTWKFMPRVVQRFVPSTRDVTCVRRGLELSRNRATDFQMCDEQKGRGWERSAARADRLGWGVGRPGVCNTHDASLPEYGAPNALLTCSSLHVRRESGPQTRHHPRATRRPTYDVTPSSRRDPKGPTEPWNLVHLP